jgi:signal transduction histidine kinase
MPALQRVRAWLGQRLGVRMRSALAAGAVVAVATLVAGGGLTLVVRGILLRNVRNAADDRAAQVAAALTGGDPAPLDTDRRRAADRSLVQVLDALGRVTTASAAVAGMPPLATLRPHAGQRIRSVRDLPLAHGERFLVEALGVPTPAGSVTVLVAQSAEEADDGTEAAVAALLGGMPVLALVVAAATFVFVGRTLRPVEAMRRQAATITASSLHTRLPVVATGDEIAALAATMNTMLDRIEAAATAQRRFVADASHELRSPLATVHANVELLAAAALPDGAATSVSRIRAETARMARLVEDLLLLARADDTALALRVEDVDLDDLVYSERDRITAEHPELRLDGRVSPVRVTGDPHQLHRLLRNLVDNATRHAAHQVTLSVVTDGEHAEVVVGNDGPPIPPEARERIFHRFVRLDDSRSRRGGGSGLGLPIARDIAQAHGGSLTAEDTRGAGARMRLRLPLTPSAAA